MLSQLVRVGKMLDISGIDEREICRPKVTSPDEELFTVLYFPFDAFPMT